MRGEYDAFVIGAGPAGAIAARELARTGRSVLLVDKATFPRRKVCGCCLNGNALAALASVGLGELPATLGAMPLHSLVLATDGRTATIPLSGVSVSREALDAALIREAVNAGAEFVPGCKARMGEVRGGWREVGLELLASREGVDSFRAGSVSDGLLKTAAHASGSDRTEEFAPSRSRLVRAAFVIAADGLNGRAAAPDAPATALSRIGAGAVVPPQTHFAPGSIFMATNCGGYVGLVVLENGQLDIAAAFDTGFVRAVGGLGHAATRVLTEAGFPAIPNLHSVDWKGTPALTRAPARIAGERWFAVGDASGYVEPFTGEGMAWAIGGAAAVARLAADGWSPTLPAKWERLHRQLIGRRQRFCRLLAPALRSRLIRRMMVRALAAWPALAAPFVRGLNHPPALVAG